jgi:outer membrane lipoprotein-sorting protein
MVLLFEKPPNSIFQCLNVGKQQFTARNRQRVYSLLPFSATVTVTTLPVASEKSNGNVTVGLALRQYREVQYLQPDCL